MQKIDRSNILNVYTNTVVVAQSGEALRYKQEIRGFDFGIFH
jgi:hypothetical protein